MTIRPKHLQLLKVIAATAFTALLLVFAPTAAKAHAGHNYSHAAVAQQGSKPNAAKPASAHQALKAAATQTSQKANDCSDRGCCDNGPCTGCHGFVLVAVPDTMPPLVSRLLIIGGSPPHLSPQVYRLRRPPKSFA